VESLLPSACIDPFLLIVRTSRIFTAAIFAAMQPAASTGGYSDFPAYSQIY
jgi:hypothetical protein